MFLFSFPNRPKYKKVLIGRLAREIHFLQRKTREFITKW